MTSPDNVGIVLSGGGPKLFTHIGFLEALGDAGLLNEQVSAVVGTSAGSIAGAFYAVGYTPQEAWKTLYWHAWGYDLPDDDGRRWRGDTRPRPLNSFISLDFDNMERALTRNVSYFKGLDSGREVETKLRQYLDWGNEEPDGAFLGTVPPERRKPLYVIALNITNRRQAVFHFEAHCRPHEVEIESARLLAPGLGREAYYEYYFDVQHVDEPPQEQLYMWEAVRCSTGLPPVFRPYLKRLALDIWDGGAQTRVTQTAYYTDGGSRDNYSLSTACKLAACDAVVGQYLGHADYPFQVVGHGTVVDVIDRNIGAMMQTTYEADQDDAEIYVNPVRTIMPIVHVRSGVTFDLSDIGRLKEAGYMAAAYYLWKCTSGKEDREFLESLLAGQIELDWETVFRAGEDTWGDAARGHRETPPPDSRYYLARPTLEFVEMAQALFEEQYAAPRSMAAPVEVRRLSLEEELERRNRERREIASDELDQPIFHGPLQEAQGTIVKWGRRLAWLSVTGIVAYGLTVLWIGVGLVASPLALRFPPSLLALIAGEITILLLSLVIGWLGYRWIVRLIWQQIQQLIASRIGVE